MVSACVDEPAAMVKLAFEMSKKILPTASTLMRAVEVGVLGRMTVSEPSFGVEATRTVGKVLPPSVESEILTLAALTGAFAVFATSQVTVCGTPAVQVTFVFGEVTRNGPAPALTTTVFVAVLMPPPPARLSRTVTRKLMVRWIVGRTSPMIVGLFNRFESFGNVRDGLVVGLKERRIGLALPSLSLSGGEAGPRSYSSQQ